MGFLKKVLSILTQLVTGKEAEMPKQDNKIFTCNPSSLTWVGYRFIINNLETEDRLR